MGQATCHVLQVICLGVGSFLQVRPCGGDKIVLASAAACRGNGNRTAVGAGVGNHACDVGMGKGIVVSAAQVTGNSYGGKSNTVLFRLLATEQ